MKRDWIGVAFYILDNAYSHNRLIASGDVVLTKKQYEKLHRALGEIDRKFAALRTKEEK